MNRIIIILAAMFALAGQAVSADAPLTVDTAKRFVASLESVESLGEEFVANGKSEKLLFDVKPKAGEQFTPYSKSVSALKAKYPADYSRLSAAVKPHGFSAEAWGDAGDRVMISYLAIKMEKENPQAIAQMQAMDPKMLEMLPPEMKEQLAQAQIMMQTVANAPEADKKVVAEVVDELDEYMDASAAKHSGH